jgi:hypothetical protein
MSVRLYYIVIVTGPRQRDGLFLIRIPQGQGIFLFLSLELPERLRDPPSNLFTRHRCFFPPGLKRSEPKINLSPPSSPDVKNKWSFISAAPVCLQIVDTNSIGPVPFTVLNRISFQ